PVWGFDCISNPQCTPTPDGSGCCDPDTCTLKVGGEVCRDDAVYENAACKKGNCSASGVCVPNGNNAGNGNKCIDHGNVMGGVEQVSGTANPCTMGTCSAGVCNTTNSNSEPRCNDDGNRCTEECFLNGGSPNVYTCGENTTLLNNLDCFTGDVNACYKGR